MRPDDGLPARIEARLQPVDAGGAVLVVLHVVLARPHDLHRGTHRLRRLQGFLDEIQLEAPAEAAAQVGRVHRHLLRRHATDLGAEPLDARLELGGGPDVDAVGAHVGGAVHGLHGRVREERQLIVRVELRRGCGAPRVGIAVVARDHPRLAGALGQEL